MSGDRGPSSCEERYHDDLAAYAVGALTAGEAAELERHLAECAACSERLRWLEPAVDLLPATVPQLEPRRELRESLMATVREEAAAEGVGVAGETEGEGARGAEEPSGRRRLLPHLRLAPARPAFAAIAVLAVLAAGVAGYVIGAGGSGGEVEAFAVEPVQPSVDASGTVEVRDGTATLVLEDLPEVASNQVYQAWIGRGGELAPSSTFVPEQDGEAEAAIAELPEDTERIVITREPEGGSEVATTAPVLQASLD